MTSSNTPSQNGAFRQLGWEIVQHLYGSTTESYETEMEELRHAHADDRALFEELASNISCYFDCHQLEPETAFEWSQPNDLRVCLQAVQSVLTGEAFSLPATDFLPLAGLIVSHVYALRCLAECDVLSQPYRRWRRDAEKALAVACEHIGRHTKVRSHFRGTGHP